MFNKQKFLGEGRNLSFKGFHMIGVEDLHLGIHNGLQVVIDEKKEFIMNLREKLHGVDIGIRY